MIKIMLKTTLANPQFSEMCIRRCDVQDHPASIRGSTAGRIWRERSTTDSGPIALVKYVKQGGIIKTHDDIPDNVREQLYAEERERLSKQNKSANGSAGSMPPQININILPTQSSQPVISSSWRTEATPISDQADYLDIPGPREAVVEEYANWHLSRVNSDSYKENIMRARDIALENCLDLG